MVQLVFRIIDILHVYHAKELFIGPAIVAICATNMHSVKSGVDVERV